MFFIKNQASVSIYLKVHVLHIITSSIPISHVVIIHQPIMIWLKKLKFHWTIFRSYS